MAYILACSLFAIYYSILQAKRFFRNEDASVISFRSFNKHSDDKYPDLTFCIQGGHFNDLIDEYQIPESNFSSILKGDTKSSQVSIDLFQKFATMDPKAYFTDLTEVLKSMSIKTSSKTTYMTGRKEDLVDVKDKDQVNLT